MVRIAKVMAKMSWVPKWRALDDSQYQFQLYRVQAQHNLVVIVLRLAVACCNKNLESRNHLQTYHQFVDLGIRTNMLCPASE